MKFLLCVCLIAIPSLCRAQTDSTETRAASTAAAPQFLNWEHTLTTRTSQSKLPVAKLKIYNNWTASQHRLLVKYNVLGLGSATSIISDMYGPSFSMPNFDPSRMSGTRAAYHHGTFGVVERLNDDRYISYNSEDGTYFIEPRRALMKRLRFDPWKKIAPELSKEAPPSLTPEQRKRFGREMRSLMRPMLKDVFRSYFRALPNTRTFTVAGEKVTARGFRMTMMFNAGNEYEGDSWYRVNSEWWLAPSAPGDEVLRIYGAHYLTDLKELNGITSSMWINETLPVLWEMMPQALHQAVATFLPKGLPLGLNAADSFNTAGVPLYGGLTLISPPEPEYARCPSCGEKHIPIPGKTVSNTIRVEAQLVRRDTRTLSQEIFSAPPQFKKESIQPALREWDEAMDELQGIFDEDVRLSDAGSAIIDEHRAPSRPTYTWGAMRNYLRAAGRFSQFPQ